MDETILTALRSLRGDEKIDILERDTNRHKLSVREDNGFTSYYFSAPIRGAENDTAAAAFYDKDGGVYMNGTSCKVCIGEGITIEGVNARIRVTIPNAGEWYRAGKDVCCGEMRISPTRNGVALRKPLRRGESVDVIITTDNAPEELRVNSKYFALMKQRFVPCFTVSAVGVFDGGKVGALLLSARPQKASGEYGLTFASPDMDGEMCVEMNMYEPKLIQDTTVESARPDENNAYGTTAFIGHSASFGVQQLYLKFNYPALGDFGRSRLSSIKLYLPVLGGDMPPLEALHMDNRFCSFGSVWNKRIKPSGKHLPITYHNGFVCVELSEVMINGMGQLKFSNGFHLRTPRDGIGYCVLATGDSCMFAPILEIRGAEKLAQTKI